MMDTFTKDPFKPISPFLELGAYETLWLHSCFDRKDISWPEKYLKQGAIRVRTMDDVWDRVGQEER